MEFEKVKQKITVRTGDRIAFVNEIVNLAVMGAKQKSNSVPKLTAPFMADFVIDVDPRHPIASTPTLLAFPPQIRAYTELELGKMEFQEFREAVALIGIKGREREKMTTDYLNTIRNREQI